MSYSIRLSILSLLVLLSSCGWQLRGATNHSAPAQLDLISPDPYSPLFLIFKETMQQRAIANKSSAPLQLHLGNESLKKRTVAVTNIGSPSQYELSLTVNYRYAFSSKSETILLAKSSSVYRVFDFDPSNTVAKNEEEETLLAEMRRELAHRILQQAPKQP